MYALIYEICFSPSDLLHSVQQALGSSTSLERIQIDSFLWLSHKYSISHYSTHHIFFIHLSVDIHLGCFHVLTIVNSAAVNMGCMYLSKLWLSLGIGPGVGLQGHMLALVLVS